MPAYLTFAGPGQGKGIDAADAALRVIAYNRKIHAKYKHLNLPLRKVGFNYHINKDIFERNKDMLFIWHDPLEMIFEDYPHNRILRKYFDCFWDEISIEVGNYTMRQTKLHPELSRFFAQHRHRGVKIFANTQDYKMVDIGFRRMLAQAHYVQKIMGSGDPDPSLPPIKHIWGLIVKWEVNIKSLENDDKDVECSRIPSFMFIDKARTDFYDTMADVSGATEFDLQHRTRKCAICGFSHDYHY
jgi:hypothetical protein